jgi:hypothetical protein
MPFTTENKKRVKVHVRNAEVDDEPAPAADSEITTKFVDDGVKAVKSFKSVLDVGGYKAEYESIKDFLGKPYLLYNFPWTTSNNVDDIIPQVMSVPVTFSPISFLGSSGASNYNPRWAEKIRCFSWIRGTVVFRVLINAQPFQAGRLLIHFLPNVADRVDVTGVNTFVGMHNCNYTTKTQQPHVILDCGDSMAELEIPYFSIYDYATIEGLQHGWGTFYISVLSKLAVGSTTATDVNVSIYMYFKDVELTGPRLPELGESKRVISKSVSSSEASAIVSSGNISDGLAQISAGIGKLGSIPYLGQFTGPASWATKALSGAAASVGYSKPDLICTPGISVRQLIKYNATADGCDTAFPLAVLSDNATNLTDGLSVRAEDEMSIDYLKQVPAMFFQYPWSTARAVDYELVNILIKPDAFFIEFDGPTKGGNTAVCATGPPIWYLSKMFDQWRGSIKLRFQFVKTIFHTGRIQVTFTPGDAATITPPTTITSDVSLRQIIDLKVSNEFTVVLPYLLPFDYQTIGGHMGRLKIVVLNPLRCPDTCSDTIQLLAWASAGPDFQYAVPKGGGSSVTGGTGYPIVYSPEVGEEGTESSSDMDSSPIGNSVIPMDIMHHATRCVGEHVNSIRQLLLRYTNTLQNTMIMTTLTANSLTIWPWYNSCMSLKSDGSVDGPNLAPDAYSFFANMYGFYKGSMKVRVATGTTSSHVSAWINPYIDNLASAKAFRLSNINTIFQSASINWLAGLSSQHGLGITQSDYSLNAPNFKVPYYNTTKCSFIDADTRSNKNVPVKTGVPKSLLNLSMPSAATTNYTYPNLQRAIGEDFQFTYFVGCPPLFVSIRGS